MWPDQWVYPDISAWPGHERWFDQRPCPATGEFTIHQNSVIAAAIYGAMMGESTDVSNFMPAEAEESPNCINVSPNPTQEGIYLEAHYLPAKLVVYNNAGQNVETFTIRDPEVYLPLPAQNGVYWLQVIPYAQQIPPCIQKVIKQEP